MNILRCAIHDFCTKYQNYQQLDNMPTSEYTTTVQTHSIIRGLSLRAVMATSARIAQSRRPQLNYNTSHKNNCRAKCSRA